GGQGLHRPRRDGVDPNVLRAQVGRQVAHAALQGRLGGAHHVVVAEDPGGTQVRQGDDAAAAGHQGAGGAGHGDQRVGADVVGQGKALAGGVDETSLQFLPAGVRDAVHEKVQAAQVGV